jgi:hypothetical protein
MPKTIIYVSVITLLIITFQTHSHAWPIPHSGQTKCYDNKNEIPCPKPGEPFYGQSGNYIINPKSYTKLDEYGNDLPDDAEECYMVRDNVTGLIWEVKQAKDNIKDYKNPHDSDNTYTWYDSNPETNYGYTGTYNSGNNTEIFIQQINESNFGGFRDWRFPSVNELASLVNLKRWDPAIDENHFYGNQSTFYWTSTSYAYNTGLMWTVHFYYGYAHGGNKDSSYYVRAVREGQFRSFDHTIINDDKTITDTKTGLIWSIDSSETKMNWENALKYCEIYSIADYSDWRLPEREELRSIVDYSRWGPAIKTNLFDVMFPFYWSSTSYANNTGVAWGIYFNGGYDYNYDKDTFNSVRAVRGGQYLFCGHLVICSPMQADILITGKTIPITWDIANIQSNVQITLSRQGGKSDTFETITPETENDGHYNWTITGPPSPNCMLKIVPISFPYSGTQQSFFTIKNPDIKVNTNTQSNFSISGPESFTGTGLSWINDNALPGTYTITYDPLNCWQTPAKESQSLTYWGTLFFSGNYAQTLADPIENLRADREIKTWSDNNEISIQWKPIDQCLKGYAFVWDHQESTVPKSVITGTSHQTVSPPLENSSNHWFHIKSINIHGKTSETTHIGPFYIVTSQHIADTNQNWHIELEEFNTFNSAWKNDIYSETWQGQMNMNVLTFSAYLMLMNIDTRYSGDVNHDNMITQDDILTLVNVLQNSSENSDNMDLDGNGYLDLQDEARLYTILYNLNKNKRNTSVLRKIKEQNCYASVQIEIIPDNRPSIAYAIEEYLPSNCLPSNIDRDGIWNETTHTIKWGTFLDDHSDILSYDLSCSTDTYSMTGVAGINGITKTISGDIQFSIVCHPVDKAIILVGSYLEDFRWDRMVKCANYAYNALMYRGYQKSQLLYLSADLYIDADQNGDCEDDIYGLSSSENLRSAITTWALDAKNLFIYLIDHGGLGTFKINQYQILKASELDQWMDLSESRIPGYIYFLYEACFSGSFIAQLKNDSMLNSRRIIMTSASNEDAHILHQGILSFSYQFWASMFETPYVYTAFAQAKAMMQAYQNPLLDADGDGIANEKKDTLIVSLLKIGNDDAVLNERPSIMMHPKCLVLHGKTSQNFTTDHILTLHPIQKVWATIVPPKKSSTATGDPILILPEIPLEFTGKEGQYAGNYSEFREDGLYKISIYAQDVKGSISLPAIIHVFSGDNTSQWQGDINMDEVVDLSDVIIGLQMLSNISLIETCSKVVSCDGDNTIDMMDILYILSEL